MKLSWYARNRERALAAGAAYRAANREAVRAHDVVRNRARADRMVEFGAAHYAANRARLLANAAKRYLADRKRILARNAAWRAANPELQRANDARRRARKTGASGEYTAVEFAALVVACGGRCLACGAFEKLTADHVVPLARGGSNGIDNIQPLCGSCNSKKHTQTIDYRTSP